MKSHDIPKPQKIDYYGSTKYMPLTLLEEKIVSTRETYQELTQELDRRNSFTSTERLADRLHALLHSAVDCDYWYSDWPQRTGCRGDAYNMASNVEKWFSIYQEKMPQDIVKDFPLGQLIAAFEAFKFGNNYVFRGLGR